MCISGGTRILLKCTLLLTSNRTGFTVRTIRQIEMIASVKKFLT